MYNGMLVDMFNKISCMRQSMTDSGPIPRMTKSKRGLLVVVEIKLLGENTLKSAGLPVQPHKMGFEQTCATLPPPVPPSPPSRQARLLNYLPCHYHAINPPTPLPTCLPTTQPFHPISHHTHLLTCNCFADCYNALMHTVNERIMAYVKQWAKEIHDIDLRTKEPSTTLIVPQVADVEPHREPHREPTPKQSRPRTWTRP